MATFTLCDVCAALIPPRFVGTTVTIAGEEHPHKREPIPQRIDICQTCLATVAGSNVSELTLIQIQRLVRHPATIKAKS